MEDNSSNLNASIITTPQWRRARELNILPHMAALRPQRNLEFGRRLRLALKAANLTQKAVSDATGIRETTLSQYVTGASRPDPEEMTKVCAIIPGLTLDYLYADDRRTLQGWLLKNIEGLEEAERRLATIIQPKKARTPSTRRA